jgi:cellulose biosynthesis protein BcsQ
MVERRHPEGGAGQMTTTIALFTNTGGVGKTTLAYHLAHMFARIGIVTVAADLDPQANLTSAFLDENESAWLWERGDGTVSSAVSPGLRGRGDITLTTPREITERLWLLPGELGLSRYEDTLSEKWPLNFVGDEQAMLRTSAFHRVMQEAAHRSGADAIIVDVGPNLGAINRAALLAADHIIVPVAADLFSLQGLRNLGPTLREWRRAC